MKKKGIIFGGSIATIMIIIFGMVVFQKKTAVSLSNGFVEMDFNEREIYKVLTDQTSLGASYPLSTAIPMISIVDGELEIELSGDVIKKEIEDEKAISILNSGTCGRYYEAIYVLTEKKNVYKLELLYNEDDDFSKDVFQNEFEKVYDSSFREYESISLVSLPSNTNRVTCYQNDVYLKINEKAYDFSLKPYTETGVSRKYETGSCGVLRYNYDGTLQMDSYEREELKGTTKIKNVDGSVIKVLLYGIENNREYMLDEDGNEYYFDIYSEVCNKENLSSNKINDTLKPTYHNKIKKIGKKGLEYEIIFENNTKKYVTIESGWSVFDEIV